MACRLPGGINSPAELWDFLLAKGDAKSRVPESRFSIDAYLSDNGKPGTTNCPYGYFLDNDLTTLDASFFTMSPKELERCDPQQRQMLEVSREVLEDAGETDWRGKKIGVFMGNFGEDWLDMLERDPQQYSPYSLTGYVDFNLSNRVSYEMDLQGPSMTIRTACSASLVALNEACLAISQGQCRSAIVGGTNLILAPSATTKLVEMGVLSPDGSCKAFSADGNGYARGEAINAVYVKSLRHAIQDGNPIRAVISGSAVNNDGKTPGFTYPSTYAQEALMRHTYKLAGIEDFSQTAFIECHGTGTPVGDPVETKAVGRVFGDRGIYIGSIKPNLGHAEGASGLNSVLKAVLALENRTIPPNIKFSSPNPNIPWESAKLQLPLDPTPWPRDRAERVSVNSFGIGGTNAHVILESAAHHSIETEEDDGPETPQLLLYSANSPDSLEGVVKSHTEYLNKYSERIGDLAYTLAQRREHLPYRSFAVSSKEQPGTVSAGTKNTQRPALVFVFTGQGAQWPQMGRDLLRNNPVFKATIKLLDETLKGLGAASPNWTIEAELRKPNKTSRLGEAELSQPLCTAIQVALVDALEAVGIKAEAVVGHSSGEIAGAYASGALTAQEAITVAYYRGISAAKQTRKGRMAAIGLGWHEATEFLVPGVTIACDNSPRSVTLSGDAEAVESVVENIKEKKPDTLARLLQVDKAYHSHHMVEIGEQYVDLVGDKVLGKSPSKPFFSSVHGKLLPAYEQLGVRYWQQNLESPVRFRSAVSHILQHPVLGKNTAFLEIGPHSALAGPLRQIVAESSSTAAAPYVAAMVRGQSSTETLLSAVGKLWALNYPVNFASLYPDEDHSTLRDLPRYHWNHSVSHWNETRVTKEWRFPKYPHHDLLGLKTVESSDLEPVWRNNFLLGNAEWVRDHKVQDDVVFPFACYIAIAGEAIRQTSGVDTGFQIRKFLVRTAMVVSDEKPTEIITTLRRKRLDSATDSQWWEFSITSHNGHAWTKHATGEVSSLVEDLGVSTVEDAELPRPLSSDKWYTAIREAGVDYGPHFQGLEQIRTSTTKPGLASALIQNNKQADVSNYHLHPTIVDTSLQLLSCGASLGLVRKSKQVLATSIEELTIRRTSSNVIVNASAAFVGKGSVLGTAEAVADGQVVMRMSGAKLALLNEPAPADTHAAARHVWRPHVDFLPSKDVLKPSFDYRAHSKILDDIYHTSLLHAHSRIAGKETSVPHLKLYQAWLQSQAEQQQGSSGANEQDLGNRIQALVGSLRDTPAIYAAQALAKISTGLVDIFDGQVEVSDVLQEDDILTQLRTYVDQYDISNFLGHLAHTKPNLRVLHLGAGTGSSAQDILKHLGSQYSKYTFSDSSTSLFASAKEKLEAYANVDYATLQIGKDLAEQGFDEYDYDLIIAVNVIHETKNIQESLTNVRKLLHPDGRLLLQELSPNSGSQWINFVRGLQPEWWHGADDSRVQEPYASTERWQNELLAAGFDVPESVVEDGQLNALFIAKPAKKTPALKKITLLARDASSDLSPVILGLQERGYSITRSTLDDAPEPGVDVISLLDAEGPFLTDITKDNFDKLKAFMDRLDGSGLLWVTPASPIQAKDPRYAQILGLARVIRSETGMHFGVVYSGDGNADSTKDTSKLLDIFAHFQSRDAEDEILTPEMEYALHEGVVKVGRLFPFVLTDLLLTSDAGDAVTLSASRSGRQAELQWSRRETKKPSGDEVQVDVYASALDSRDVRIATGSIDTSSPFLGHEAAGIVRHVGPQVQHLQAGDRVILLGHGTLATTVTESAQRVIRIPNNLSFNDAATLASAYGLVIYSLKQVGQLERGQSILIHDAAGAVGLAALQVARHAGAEIYATAGSKEEIEHLHSSWNIPQNRVFSSKDVSFRAGILRETSGEGVDVVLSSLSGELAQASWDTVAEFGRHISIGSDIGDAARPNRSFHHVDWNRLQSTKPAIIQRLLRSVLELFEERAILPIQPVAVYPATQIQDAFELVQKSEQQIEKVVIELRNVDSTIHEDPAISDRRRTPVFERAASYLLVGGLGGIGRAVAIWLIEHGARNLVFLSRSAGKPEDLEFARELETMGASVKLVAGSVTEQSVVAQAIKAAGDNAPLKGIINMTMLLRDQAWANMTWDDWHTAVGPKVQGTWKLHNQAIEAGAKLDFFVMFSSISGIIGNMGQANYGSANSFLDSFVQYRAGLGLAASTIALGAVFGVGYVSESAELIHQMKATGYHALRETDILDALTAATAPASPRALFWDGSADPRTFALGIRSLLPLTSPNCRVPWRRDPRFAVYRNESDGGSGAGAGDAGDGIKGFLSQARENPDALSTPEAADFLARAIGLKVLSLLFIPADELNLEVGLADIGMDSLVAIEMRLWWKQTLGLDISVLEMLGMGTIEVLGKYAAEKLSQVLHP
uniref:Uncharacterized protein n=1 Tax=Bionectria ochroleuca TaxID=29856 RepID=A0A0B7KGY7_BIOOC